MPAGASLSCSISSYSFEISQIRTLLTWTKTSDHHKTHGKVTCPCFLHIAAVQPSYFCVWIIRFPVLTPGLQQRYHTVGKQNMCWTKPDKAALGFRSGTANRSYLYTLPGSHSNTEPDEFALAQTCRMVSPFFLFHRDFFSDSTFSSSILCPHNCIHVGCWSAPWQADTFVLLLPLTQTAEITADRGWHVWTNECTCTLSCCSCSAASVLLLTCWAFNTAAPAVIKQIIDSVETPTAHPKLSFQLGFLHNWPRNLLLDLMMDYQEDQQNSQCMQPSFGDACDGKFTCHPDGLYILSLTPLHLDPFPFNSGCCHFTVVDADFSFSSRTGRRF